MAVRPPLERPAHRSGFRPYKLSEPEAARLVGRGDARQRRGIALRAGGRQATTAPLGRWRSALRAVLDPGGRR